MNDLEKIIALVEGERQKQGLKVSEFLARAGLYYEQWYRLSRGRTKDITLTTLKKLARGIGKHPRELIPD